MHPNLGFDDGEFEIENTQGSQITERLRGKWTDTNAAKSYLTRNKGKICEICRSSLEEVKKIVNEKFVDSSSFNELAGSSFIDQDGLKKYGIFYPRFKTLIDSRMFNFLLATFYE